MIELIARNESKPRFGSLQIGPHFRLSFQRTLRIPDDGRTYPLPPGLGHFPIHRVEDFADRVPTTWRERGGFFLPMYQREAMWLCFECSWWRAVAVQVGVGNINAISGKRWRKRLARRRQNYLVCPDQPWLDGINAGNDFIRQFVAMPLGQGYTVEGQLTGEEKWGGLQIRLVEPKPGKFPDQPPQRAFRGDAVFSVADSAVCCDMGLAAGGRMRQKIYPDPHGIDTWDEDNATSVFVHIANSETYREITGLVPPPTPVSAQLYTSYGLPWFDLYDDHLGDLEPSTELAGVDSIATIDLAKGVEGQEEESVDVSDKQVIVLG